MPLGNAVLPASSSSLEYSMRKRSFSVLDSYGAVRRFQEKRCMVMKGKKIKNREELSLEKIASAFADSDVREGRDGGAAKGDVIAQ